MQIDGSCHCGNITYEATANPDDVVLCHCTDCQTMTSSAFRIILRANEDDFRLTGGTLKVYVKTAESGNPREQTFCGDCGTPIYSTSVGGSGRVLALRAGAVRQRDQLTPKSQIWTRSARPWLDQVSTLPGAERQ